MVEAEWKENFRMSRVGCFNLASLLHPHVESQVTVMREPVSVETQLAVTLYYLSAEGRLRKVVNAFGLSRSCCSIIVRRVSSAVTTHLGPLYIKLPTTETSVKERSTSSTKHFVFHSAWELLTEPILRLNSRYLTHLTISIESHVIHSTFKHCVITVAVSWT